MLPNGLPKVQNISRSFATDLDFNRKWSKFVYDLGKNGSGNRHLSVVSGVTNVYFYPRGINNLTKVRYEVELVLIHNAADVSYMVFAVSEFNGYEDTAIANPHLEYLASFKVPKSFDLEAISRSHFERPVVDDTDETFSIDAGLGSSLIVLSKKGLQKVGQISSSHP
nr:hypothetical protein ORM20_00197 [Ochrobactrum phage ORM_20]